MAFKILFVDDEKGPIEKFIHALTKRGFQVEYVRSIEEAMTLYNQESFDLIVLDLLMPPGSASQEVILEIGLKMYSHLRSMVVKVPVIVLTQLPAAEHRHKFEADERTLLFNKGEIVPFELPQHCTNLITQWPLFDGVIYHVRDSLTLDLVPGHFLPLENADVQALDEAWTFGANFAHYYQQVPHRGCVLKLCRLSDGDNRVQGVLFTAALFRDWPNDVLLESAPWNAFTGDDADASRELLWVGKVMVAWLLQESLRRNIKEFSIRVGNAGDFFTRIGFKQLPLSRDVYYMTHRRALGLLDEVFNRTS